MRTERARLLLIAAALLLATPAGLRAQTPPEPAPAPAASRAKPKPPAPPAPKAQTKPPAPPKATPKPAPQPPPPAAHPEDDAIIEQLELFMLMEMLKDYEILREPEK